MCGTLFTNSAVSSCLNPAIIEAMQYIAAESVPDAGIYVDILCPFGRGTPVKTTPLERFDIIENGSFSSVVSAMSASTNPLFSCCGNLHGERGC